MKLFDALGLLTLLGWFAAIGFVIDATYFETQAIRQSESIVMTPGESWMILRHEDQDIGYVHETRSAVGDGWLLEYALMMNIKLVGIQRSFSADIKGRIDPDGYLESVVADVDGGGRQFEVSGTVDGNTVTIVSDLGVKKEQKITLKERPKLSTSVYRRLAAIDTLSPGEIVEDEYFDPMTMGTKTMTFEFVEQKEIDNFETKVMTRKFRQQLNGQELDVLIDLDGNVQIQEFPFRIVGNRVPNTYGASRAKALRKQKSDDSGADFDLNTATQLLEGRSVVATGDIHTFEVRTTPDFVVTSDDAPPTPKFDLNSVGQKITGVRTDDEGHTIFSIDTSLSASIVAPEPWQTEAMLAETTRVDFSHDAFSWVDKIPEAAVEMRARKIGEHVRDTMRTENQVTVDTASGAATSKSGDCTEHSLVLVAGLRRAKIPARFIYGVKHTKDGQIPHQWVEFWDGAAFKELDATTADLSLGPNAIRLMADVAYDAPRFIPLVDQIQVTPKTPNAEPIDADFN